MSGVKVYWSSVTGNMEMKKQQKRIVNVLEGKKIPFEQVDIAQNAEEKDLMRKLAGNPTALPPQIFKGDVYLGDFKAFENAIEDEQLETFLKIEKK